MTKILSGLAFAAALSAPAAAQAQTPPPAPHQPRIVVAGEGESAVRPDMAWLSLSVLREGATAREALDKANEATAGVIAALKQAGIQDRDLQTTRLSIEPKYVYPQNNDGNQQPKIVGYQVSNALMVRVNELAKVGDLLDRAVTLGVNQGGGITFDNSNPTDAREAARKEAVADAKARASTLAEAAGAKLGPVLEIVEQPMVEAPIPMQPKVMRMEAADARVPVQPGENTYRVNVTVTFAIER